MSGPLSPVIPFLRYRDAAAAVPWLQNAFGFEPVVVESDDDGNVVHASLRFGTGAIILGPADEGLLNMRSPRDLPATSQGIYVHLESDGDVDKRFEQAREAGAEVVIELMDMPYGSREFTVRDLEGHVWSFGTYLPSAQ
jgi:uncharacterized glyoxalase superfamily protein PhnB